LNKKYFYHRKFAEFSESAHLSKSSTFKSLLPHFRLSCWWAVIGSSRAKPLMRTTMMPSWREQHLAILKVICFLRSKLWLVT